MAWALIIPLGSLLGSSLDWALEEGGRIPYKNALPKIGIKPLRETYLNKIFEHNGAHKLTYKENECQTSNCGSNHNNLTSLFVKVKKKKKQDKTKKKQKKNKMKQKQ